MVLEQTKVEIRAVTTPADSEMFLDVPELVYAKDTNWVPPIRSSIGKYFTPNNPFLQYGKLQQFIALSPEQNKGAVGRIVAAVNQRLIERENQNIGLIGFFECIEDFKKGMSRNLQAHVLRVSLHLVWYMSLDLLSFFAREISRGLKIIL